MASMEVKSFDSPDEVREFEGNGRANVVQIGGLSIMDRGHTSVLPLLDEIVANQDRHTQVIGVGPGVQLQDQRATLVAGLERGAPHQHHGEPRARAFLRVRQADGTFLSTRPPRTEPSI